MSLRGIFSGRENCCHGQCSTCLELQTKYEILQGAGYPSENAGPLMYTLLPWMPPGISGVGHVPPLIDSRVPGMPTGIRGAEHGPVM